MMRVSRLALGFALPLVFASLSAAQDPLLLQIRNGQVTLKAQNVTLRTILTEWARVGGTNIVGADRAGGAPVTIELTEVPERQALDVLLRNVSGYMLAMRPTGVQGVSAYNRILIMPPSAAPRALPPQAAAVAPRFQQANPTDDADDIPPDVVLEGPGGGRPGQPVRLPNVTGGPPPAPLPVPETSGPEPSQTPGVVVVGPGNPFGVPAGSSSQPGVISPAPAPTLPRPEPPD
ncbi:MAG: hypothetical protein ABL986_08170 [Vicinamibacterales bacterium]